VSPLPREVAMGKEAPVVIVVGGGTVDGVRTAGDHCAPGGEKARDDQPVDRRAIADRDAAGQRGEGLRAQHEVELDGRIAQPAAQRDLGARAGDAEIAERRVELSSANDRVGDVVDTTVPARGIAREHEQTHALAMGRCRRPKIVDEAGLEDPGSFEHAIPYAIPENYDAWQEAWREIKAA